MKILSKKNAWRLIIGSVMLTIIAVTFILYSAYCRARYRSFADVMLLNISFLDNCPNSQIHERDSVIYALFLDYMISDAFEPLHDDLRRELLQSEKLRSISREEIIEIMRDRLKDVEKVAKQNACFFDDKGMRMLYIPLGSPRVPNDLSGDDARKFVEKIIEEFAVYAEDRRYRWGDGSFFDEMIIDLEVFITKEREKLRGQ